MGSRSTPTGRCWRYQDRDRAALVAARAGRLLGYLLIALGLVNALAGLAAGLWFALIGWFILSGAGAEQAAARDEHLKGLKAEDVMTPTSIHGPAWWTVEQFVAQLSPSRVTVGVFPVVDLNGHVAGVITLADLEAVPPKNRANTQLGALAARRGSPVVVSPDVDAADVAARIRLQGGIAVVALEDRPIGVISVLELSRAAHLAVLGWRAALDRR